MRLIDADSLIKAIDNRREYLISRGLTGAEHIIVKGIRDLVESAPTVIVDNYSMGYQDGVREVLSARPKSEWFDRRAKSTLKEREFLDKINISELSDEEKLKLVKQIMPDNKFDEIIIAHERTAYERGVADGYAEAIEEGKNEKRLQGECENCDFRKFSEMFVDGVVDVMNKNGITSVEELQEILKGGAE